MKEIREEVINFMENSPTFSKLKGEKWFQVEDELTGLVCKILNCEDTTYEQSEEPTNQLDQLLKKNQPNSFEEKIYRKVSRYYQYEDLQNLLKDNEESYDEQKLAKIKENASRIAQTYDDNLDYDWRTALKEAIEFVIN